METNPQSTILLRPSSDFGAARANERRDFIRELSQIIANSFLTQWLYGYGLMIAQKAATSATSLNGNCLRVTFLQHEKLQVLHYRYRWAKASEVKRVLTGLTE